MGQTDLKEAIKTLKLHLINDPDYRRSWLDNISMSFQDEYKRKIIEMNNLDTPRNILKEIGDGAADRFLHILCSNHN